jgi:hypothetical protein
MRKAGTQIAPSARNWNRAQTARKLRVNCTAGKAGICVHFLVLTHFHAPSILSACTKNSAMEDCP